jgi:hypothetical protein
MHSLQFAPTSRDFGGVRNDRASTPAAERPKIPIAAVDKYKKIRPKQGSRPNSASKNIKRKSPVRQRQIANPKRAQISFHRQLMLEHFRLR